MASPDGEKVDDHLPSPSGPPDEINEFPRPGSSDDGGERQLVERADRADEEKSHHSVAGSLGSPGSPRSPGGAELEMFHLDEDSSPPRIYTRTRSRSPSGSRSLGRRSSRFSRNLAPIPRAERRGLFGRFAIIPEIARPYDYRNSTKWVITAIVALAGAAAPIGSSVFYRESIPDGGGRSTHPVARSASADSPRSCSSSVIH